MTGNNSEMQRAFAEKVRNMVGMIRQNIQNHGGNIELLSIGKNNAVKLRVQCGSQDVPEAQQALETGVKALLKMRVPEVGEVLTVD